MICQRHDNVPAGTKAAFVLPNTKLDKDGGKMLQACTANFVSACDTGPLSMSGIQSTKQTIFLQQVSLTLNIRKFKATILKTDRNRVKQGRHDINSLTEKTIRGYWVCRYRKRYDDSRYSTRLLIDKWASVISGPGNLQAQHGRFHESSYGLCVFENRNGYVNSRSRSQTVAGKTQWPHGLRVGDIHEASSDTSQ